MSRAILVSSVTEASETFVKKHIQDAGPDAQVIYGGTTPSILKGKEKLFQDKFTSLKFHILKAFGFEYDKRTYILKKILTTQKIKYCYAEFGPVGVGVLDACKHSKVKLIVNFHGYDAFVHDVLKIYSEKYIELFEYASKIVVVSQSMAKQIELLGCPAKKILVIPCFPSNSFNIVPISLNKNVLFIGRLVEKKGPWLTLLAFKKVVDEIPDAHLTIAGDGPLLPICKSLVSKLNIDNVTFTGSVNHEEVLSLLKQSSIYTQHSIVAVNGDREGTPVSVMEAMSAGIPVICSMHEGINDIVENRESGLLFEMHDINQQAKLIIDLLNSPDRGREIGIAGKKRIESIMSESLSIDDIFNICINP